MPEQSKRDLGKDALRTDVASCEESQAATAPNKEARGKEAPSCEHGTTVPPRAGSDAAAAPDAAVRDLARGAAGAAPAVSSGRRHARAVPAALAVVSLALVLGSAGYFALNPGAFAGQAGQLAYPEDGTVDAPEQEGLHDARVEPGAKPVDEPGASAVPGGADGRKDDASSADRQDPHASDAGQSGPSGGGVADSGSSDSKPSGNSAGKPGSSKPSGGGASGGKPSGGSGGASGGGKPGSSQQGGGSGGGSAEKPGGGTTAPAPKTVTISISVDSSAADGSVSSSGTFTFNEGATVYDALCALGLSIGSRQSAYGVYVSSIGGLAEKQFGASSGWMYAVNGSFPSVACNAYALKDGDSIQWRYVTG